MEKKKILNKKIIFGYVRCEKKTCVNKYKPLKVPKILIGKQKCQICKNIMMKEDSKQIDAVYKLFDKSKPNLNLLIFIILSFFSKLSLSIFSVLENKELIDKIELKMNKNICFFFIKNGIIFDTYFFNPSIIL